MALTPEDIETEYWAHYFHDKPASESGEDDDFDMDELIEAMDNGENWEDL